MPEPPPSSPGCPTWTHPRERMEHACLCSRSWCTQPAVWWETAADMLHPRHPSANRVGSSRQKSLSCASSEAAGASILCRDNTSPATPKQMESSLLSGSSGVRCWLRFKTVALTWSLSDRADVSPLLCPLPWPLWQHFFCCELFQEGTHAFNMKAQTTSSRTSFLEFCLNKPVQMKRYGTCLCPTGIQQAQSHICLKPVDFSNCFFQALPPHWYAVTLDARNNQQGSFR